jgi:rhodanese-related sulfurtransferase
MSKVITLQELRAKLDAGEELVLVEALGPQYFEAAHLPGAINVPHTEVEALAPALLPDRGAQIVVYCSDGSCPNSGIAVAKLTALGYTDVRKYHEGKAEWREASLPLESGPAPVRA